MNSDCGLLVNASRAIIFADSTENFAAVAAEKAHDYQQQMEREEPRAYSESQQITDYLKARNAVVVNLKRVTPDQAKRIVDFLSGTLYAIGGDLQKLGGGIFLCTPNNVNVEGKISDDREANQKEVQAKDEDIDFNNW